MSQLRVHIRAVILFNKQLQYCVGYFNRACKIMKLGVQLKSIVEKFDYVLGNNSNGLLCEFK